MRFVFRVDSSRTIGIGHAFRCRALAEELRRRGHSVVFVCRELAGNAIQLLRAEGFEVLILPLASNEHAANGNSDDHTNWLEVSQEEDARATREALTPFQQIDWIIVDHYSIDSRWEGMLRTTTRRILVIDDVADRKHDCDALLDQNLFTHMEERYSGLVPGSCKFLLGPTYALLRPEFHKTRSTLKPRTGTPKRVLISMGGSDVANVTGKVVQALKNEQLAFDIVVGPANINGSELKSLCSGITDCTIHSDARNMAELMAKADVAVGASGSTAWERCCMGLPSMLVSIAKNQEDIGEALKAHGVAHYIGDARHISVQKIVDEFKSMTVDSARLRYMSQRAWELVDGLGVSRIASVLCEE